MDGPARGDSRDARLNRAKGIVADEVRAPVGPGDRRAERVGGERCVDVDVVGAASTWNVAAVEVPPPGVGLTTVMWKLPVGREVARGDRRRQLARRQVGRRQRGRVPVDDRLTDEIRAGDCQGDGNGISRPRSGWG